MTTSKEELVALSELLPEVYNRLRGVGMIRTSRAVADAIRLLQWESAAFFDHGNIPRLRHDDYAKDVLVEEVDEVSLI